MRDLVSSFRHDPSKSALTIASRPQAILWAKEPTVIGYRRLTYHNSTLDREVNTPISASPAVIRDFGVIVASDDGYVRFFGRQLKKVYWRKRMKASVYASLVVDPVSEQVIVADTSGTVCALDLRGKTAWVRDLKAPIFATPAVHASLRRLVVGAFGHKAFCLNLETGEIVFENALPQPWHAARSGVASHRNPYASPAVTASGQSVFCAGQSVLCLSPEGDVLWETALSAEIKASPVVEEDIGVVAVSTVSGQVQILQISDGAEVECVQLDAKVTASSAVSQGIIAVGTTTGAVYGISLVDAQIIWRKSFGAPRSYTSFTLTPLGDFAATGLSGNVMCLAVRTGAFLWESAQVLGLPNHEPTMDITPVIAPHGAMYGASYEGDLYEFAFDQKGEI